MAQSANKENRAVTTLTAPVSSTGKTGQKVSSSKTSTRNRSGPNDSEKHLQGKGTSAPAHTTKQSGKKNNKRNYEESQGGRERAEELEAEIAALRGTHPDSNQHAYWYGHAGLIPSHSSCDRRGTGCKEGVRRVYAKDEDAPQEA